MSLDRLDWCAEAVILVFFVSQTSAPKKVPIDQYGGEKTSPTNLPHYLSMSVCLKRPVRPTANALTELHRSLHISLGLMSICVFLCMKFHLSF